MTQNSNLGARKGSARWNNALKSIPDAHEIRKRALVLAAGRVFGRKGFHNTTMDDIAAALSVTKPALYRHIRSKHEILYECHRLAIGLAEDALATAQQRNRARPLETLHMFAALYIRKMTDELGTCAVLTEYYSMTAEHNALIQERRRAVDHQLRALVATAIEMKAISPCDPKKAVFYFMGAINSVSRWYSDKGQEAGDAIADAFADFTIRSLGPIT